MNKRSFILAHDEARRNAVAAIRSAPDGYHVEVKEPTRNLAQNAAIHAELTKLGEAIGWKWHGQEIDTDDLKSIFVAAFRKVMGQGNRFCIGLDGQPVILNWRTRDFSKREASEFMEMLNAWKVENLK